MGGARTLDLSGHGLTEVPPEVFGLADTLELLDLGRNPLARLPDDFARLRRLKVLFCSGTRFRVLPPVLGDCAALSQIGFRGCDLEAVPAEALPQGLQWLTLTDNRIARLPDALGRRPALQKLMLAGNRLTGLPWTLADAASLELLRIAANRFDHLPDFLADLPRLAWLAFAGNPAEGPSGQFSPSRVPWTALRQGDLLGEGASGRVHGAVWTRDGRKEPVALKLFKGEMTSDGLPAREMEAALAVGPHPAMVGAIARVDDHPDGVPRLLLPLIPPHWRSLAKPPSLESCSRDVYDPAFSLIGGVACRIARSVASAGAHLHALGLLHGDLYAHNIHWDAARGDAVLGDFGAAARIPDSIVGRLCGAFDVRAWGILVAELLARTNIDEQDATLPALGEAARDPNPAARPRFADILDAMPTDADRR